jgi:hypothetical protein
MCSKIYKSNVALYLFSVLSLSLGVACFFQAAPPTGTPVPQSSIIITGYVVDGGDTTPGGLLDAPREFIYTVETDQEPSSQVLITYTSFPPSPRGDAQMNKIRLEFHKGQILQGQYLRASGKYDPASNTLIVEEEGDFIETFPEKP